jgi:hypothetical protein
MLFYLKRYASSLYDLAEKLMEATRLNTKIKKAHLYCFMKFYKFTINFNIGLYAFQSNTIFSHKRFYSSKYAPFAFITTSLLIPDLKKSGLRDPINAFSISVILLILRKKLSRDKNK